MNSLVMIFIIHEMELTAPTLKVCSGDWAKVYSKFLSYKRQLLLLEASSALILSSESLGRIVYHCLESGKTDTESGDLG